MKDEEEPTGVVNKIIQILDVFAQATHPLGVTELAELTGLNISTVYRIASALANHGYLRKEGKRGKYSLGFKFIKFNNMLNNTLLVKEIAQPFMEKLSTICGESTNLAILDTDKIVYIEHIESSHTLRTFTALGNRVPLHCTGVGKVFCAYMDDDTVFSLMKGSLQGFTENTITDYVTFEKQLRMVKQDGVALDNGEMDIEVRCIAAPIFDTTKKVIASISISGPYTRMTRERIEELKPLVKKYALEISREMGYEPN